MMLDAPSYDVENNDEGDEVMDALKGDGKDIVNYINSLM